MTNPDRALLKLLAQPLREQSRLIQESTEAAVTPEIDEMANTLTADIRGLGRATALEVLFKVWNILRERERNGHRNP